MKLSDKIGVIFTLLLVFLITFCETENLFLDNNLHEGQKRERESEEKIIENPLIESVKKYQSDSGNDNHSFLSSHQLFAFIPFILTLKRKGKHPIRFITSIPFFLLFCRFKIYCS